MQQSDEGKGEEDVEDIATVVDMKWEMRKRCLECECVHAIIKI